MKMVSVLVLIHETFLCCTVSLIHLFLFTNIIPILSSLTPVTVSAAIAVSQKPLQHPLLLLQVYVCSSQATSVAVGVCTGTFA